MGNFKSDFQSLTQTTKICRIPILEFSTVSPTEGRSFSFVNATKEKIFNQTLCLCLLSLHHAFDPNKLRSTVYAKLRRLKEPGRQARWLQRSL